MTINNEQIQALKGNLVIDPYYLVECGNCAEIYPSNKLAGGCQIADTGDYGDCYCPHCDASEEYEDLGNNAASAWNYQQKCIDALLAERNADKALIAEQAKQIDELEDKQRETLRQARSFREAHESAAEIIRRYESKTIKLTLPTTRLWAGQVDCYEAKEILIAVRAACATAGITLVVGE